jgi:hypothetical protein
MFTYFFFFTGAVHGAGAIDSLKPKTVGTLAGFSH